MKQIQYLLSDDCYMQTDKGKGLSKLLAPLFKDKKFRKDVKTIREQFNIPACGFEPPLGVTDQVSKIEQERRLKQFKIEMSLRMDVCSLRAIKLAVKSRRKEYLKAVSLLRQKWFLPPRYDLILADSVIMLGRFPFAGEHLAKGVVRVFRDGSENRIFIEIFGDTTRKDVEDIWNKVIKRMKLQKAYHLLGSHLYRHHTFYDAGNYENDEDLVDENILPVRDYAHKGTIIRRKRKKIEEDYSK